MTTQPDAVGPEQVGVDGGDAGHQPVGRSAFDQLVRLRRCRWAAMASAPYSTKLPGSHTSATFSRAVRCPVAPALATASGRASSSPISCRPHLGQVRPLVVEVEVAAATGGGSAHVHGLEHQEHVTFDDRVTYGHSELRRTSPATTAAMTCSIFMASITTSAWPACTRSPATDSQLTMVPCMGAATAT